MQPHNNVGQQLWGLVRPVGTGEVSTGEQLGEEGRSCAEQGLICMKLRMTQLHQYQLWKASCSGWEGWERDKGAFCGVPNGQDGMSTAFQQQAFSRCSLALTYPIRTGRGKEEQTPCSLTSDAHENVPG